MDKITSRKFTYRHAQNIRRAATLVSALTAAKPQWTHWVCVRNQEWWEICSWCFSFLSSNQTLNKQSLNPTWLVCFPPFFFFTH